MCFNEVTLLHFHFLGSKLVSFSEVKRQLQESFANISDSFLVLQEVTFLFWSCTDCMHDHGNNRRLKM